MAHHNGETCSLCVRVKLFQKTLAKSDIKEGRVYIPTRHAAMLTYSDQIPDNVPMNIPFYDSEKKLKHTIELRKRDHKCYLGRGWREYAPVKGLKEYDSFTVYELKCGRGTGERIFFEIEGSADEAARRGPGRFDRNDPPPEKGSSSHKFDLNKLPSSRDG